MIRIGYIDPNSDDSFFYSFDNELLKRLKIKGFHFLKIGVPFDESSVDALFITAGQVEALSDAIDLEIFPWVMIATDEAFAYSALCRGAAYLLLPSATYDDYLKALERLRRRLSAKDPVEHALAAGHSIDLPLTKGRKVSIRTHDILFLEAHGEVTEVHTSLQAKEKVVTTRNLGFWEKQLDEAFFIRIHKKYIVNLSHILSMAPDGVLTAKGVLPVATRRRRGVEKRVVSHQMFV